MATTFRLRPKFIETKLVLNWGLSDFSTHFKVSEEEFLKQLEREFQKDAADRFASKMRKNDDKKKKNQKRSIKKAKMSQRAYSNSERENPSTSSSNYNDNNEEENIMTAANKITELTGKRETLLVSMESLKEKENKLKEERDTLETECTKVQNFYEKVFAEVQKYKVKLDEIISKMEANDKSFAEINENKTGLKNSLAEIDKQISELSAIKVNCGVENSSEEFKYSDAEFAIEPAEIKAKTHEIIDSEISELLEEMSMQSLKKLARYMLIAEKLEKEEEKCVEFYFSTGSEITTALELLEKKVVIII